MMSASDTPTGVLVLGVAALVVTTIVSSLALPSVTLRRRRRARSFLPATPRRVITGRPVELSAAPMTVPGGRDATAMDHGEPPAVRSARRYLHHLVDHDPEQIAAALRTWIDSDTDEDDRIDPRRRR